MTLRNTTKSYGSISKFFHWLTFFLVITMLGIGFALGYDLITNKPTKIFFVNLHKLVGLLVLGIILARLLWLFSDRKPISLNQNSRLSKFVEHAVHTLLYISILTMTLSGWIMSTTAGKAPNFFGLFTIPFPGIPPNEALSDFTFEVHEISAWFLLGLISIHVLAALKHHYIDKDHIMQRMMPRKKL